MLWQWRLCTNLVVLFLLDAIDVCRLLLLRGEGILIFIGVVRSSILDDAPKRLGGRRSGLPFLVAQVWNNS